MTRIGPKYDSAAKRRASAPYASMVKREPEKCPPSQAEILERLKAEIKEGVCHE